MSEALPHLPATLQRPLKVRSQVSSYGLPLSFECSCPSTEKHNRWHMFPNFPLHKCIRRREKEELRLDRSRSNQYSLKASATRETQHGIRKRRVALAVGLPLPIILLLALFRHH